MLHCMLGTVKNRWDRNQDGEKIETSQVRDSLKIFYQLDGKIGNNQVSREKFETSKRANEFWHVTKVI